MKTNQRNPMEGSNNFVVSLVSEELVGLDDLADWSEYKPRSFRLAVWWAQTMSRGKGYVSRFVGKHLLNNKKIVIQTRSKALLAVNPSNLDTYTYILANGGVMAASVIDTCCHLLEDGMVFYDVGANAGVVSIEVAKAFGDRVSVYAFEPQEALARCITISAQLNGFKNTQVFRTLLGNTAGTAELFIPKSTAPASHASMRSRSSAAEVVKCNIESLDRLVNAGLIPPPNVIKIDVEGAELSVLQGAARLIERHKPSIIFESDTNAERFGYTRRDICEYLQERGAYHFQFPTTDGLINVGDRLYDSAESDVVAVCES